MKELAPHQFRVLEEKYQLDQKIQKLSEFIGNLEFNKLHPEEQKRLSRQSEAMAVYSGILGERIAAFPELTKIEAEAALKPSQKKKKS